MTDRSCAHLPDPLVPAVAPPRKSAESHAHGHAKDDAWQHISEPVARIVERVLRGRVA